MGIQWMEINFLYSTELSSFLWSLHIPATQSIIFKVPYSAKIL